MKWQMAIVLAAFSLLVTAGPTAAHHSTAMYDNEHPVTVTGMVKKFDWTNPHSWIWIDVANEQGGVDTWGIKGAGIAHFVVAGLVVLPVYLFVVRSVAGLSLRKLLVAIGPPVAGSIGAGLSAALAMRATNGALQSLVVGLGAGLVVYLIIVGPWLWRVLQRAHTLWSAVGTGPSPLAGAAAAS